MNSEALRGIITHQNSGPLIISPIQPKSDKMITSLGRVKQPAWNFWNKQTFPTSQGRGQKKRPNPTTTHDSIRKNPQNYHRKFGIGTSSPPNFFLKIWCDLQSLGIYRFLAGANSMKCQEQVPGDIHFDACILGSHKCCLLELNMYPCNIHQPWLPGRLVSGPVFGGYFFQVTNW